MLLRDYASRLGLGAQSQLARSSAEVVDSAPPKDWPACLAALASDGPSNGAIQGCVEQLSERRLEQSIVAADLLGRIAVDPDSFEGFTLTLWATRLKHWPRLGDHPRLLDWAQRDGWTLASDEAQFVDDPEAAFERFALGAWGNPKLDLREFAATEAGCQFLTGAGSAALRAGLPGLGSIYLHMAMSAAPQASAARFLFLECLLDLGASIEAISTLLPDTTQSADLLAYVESRILLRDCWTGFDPVGQRSSGPISHAITVLTTEGASRQLSAPVAPEDWPFGNLVALASKLRDSRDGAELAAFQGVRYLGGLERAWLAAAVPRWASLLVDDTHRTLARVPADRSLWQFLATRP